MSPNGNDPYNLQRFVNAQEYDYALALAEIKAGRKRSHWIWYIFPQIDGLGFSPMSKTYAIKSLAEARAYLEHPILGARLREISEAVLDVQNCSANEIFGSPDDLKLRSCMTLFEQVAGPGSVFNQVLEKFYNGQPDQKTLALLKSR